MLIPIDGAVRSTVTVWLSLAVLPMVLLTCALMTYAPPSASAETSALPSIAPAAVILHGRRIGLAVQGHRHRLARWRVGSTADHQRRTVFGGADDVV